MPIRATVIADSVSEAGERLTTFELEYPRFVHSELMTHRVFSRNAGSTRATPIEKFMERVSRDPAMPVRWGVNGKGMQDHGIADPAVAKEAERIWLQARDSAVEAARQLANLGIHKQIANRILEPWQHIVVLVSATSWGNWYHLRRDAQAQPEIKTLADAMWEAHASSSPKLVLPGEWHLPLVQPEEVRLYSWADLCKISTGRCARVSYLTHHGVRDVSADIDLHDKLVGNGHWSPFEHPATPHITPKWEGNFYGWAQYRKFHASEHLFQGSSYPVQSAMGAVIIGVRDVSDFE